MLKNCTEHRRRKQHFLFSLLEGLPEKVFTVSLCVNCRIFCTSTRGEREPPNQKDFHDRDSYHFAVFSDNFLACTVVVQSTISTAMGTGEDHLSYSNRFS